jgi:hypothetical protein
MRNLDGVPLVDEIPDVIKEPGSAFVDSSGLSGRIHRAIEL